MFSIGVLFGSKFAIPKHITVFRGIPTKNLHMAILISIRTSRPWVKACINQLPAAGVEKVGHFL
jgi:hypothetical protein